ncbi:hypothetical protein VCR1J2_600066 [Vibrio coralliirubri]|nr:hypothetical protein VCR1J2_600066 [Vibrio coralliirubri]CDT92915.1 hypothetical protein VCR8J2_470065 [Vibrio coralliirubri]
MLANPKFESVTRMTLSIPTSKIVNRTKGKQNRNMLDVTKDDAIYVVSLTILMILLFNTMRRIRLNKRLPSFLLKLEQKHSHRSLLMQSFLYVFELLLTLERTTQYI